MNCKEEHRNVSQGSALNAVVSNALSRNVNWKEDHIHVSRGSALQAVVLDAQQCHNGMGQQKWARKLSNMPVK